jgi:hypothetical protein
MSMPMDYTEKLEILIPSHVTVIVNAYEEFNAITLKFDSLSKRLIIPKNLTPSFNNRYLSISGPKLL